MKRYPGGHVLTRHTTVAVDFLTITASSPERRDALFNRFSRAREALRLMGEAPCDWEFYGYVGLSIGGFRWGTRKDSDILMLSGNDAQSFWRIFAPLSTNCSRIDLAVTARTTRCIPRLLETYIDWLRQTESATLRRATWLENGQGGKTLYVNKRTSDQCGRVYDKGAEEKSPIEMHRKWRFEVEFKGERAKGVLSKLIAHDVEWPKIIYVVVYEWFDSRGIPPLWNRQHSAVDGIKLESSAIVTSTSQKLHWLQHQVRPTVQKLIYQGMEAEVVKALGIDKT